MKKDGKYRFTLQFGSGSEEQIRAGEFLERLGNRKSAVVIEALNAYLSSHPALQDGNSKIEVKVDSGYNKERMEQIVRQIVEERFAMLSLTRTQPEASQGESPKTVEDDIAQMLDNLDLFQ